MKDKCEVRGNKETKIWRVFDKKKGIIILQPMSHLATFNEENIRLVVHAANNVKQ